MENKKDFINQVSDTSFKLSLCEIGLGSLLHSLRIPLVGHALSLNQIFFLTLITKEFKEEEKRGRGAFYVSQISAILKSLSPAGKKLGPMISISMQGFLFCAPLYLFTSNYLSVVLGAMLSSLWAFLQPLITLYLLFGSNIVKAFFYYLEKLKNTFGVSEEIILSIFLIVVLLKILIAGFIALATFQGRLNISYEKVISSAKKKEPRQPSLIRDITRPMFLISFILTGVYFYFNRDVLSPTIWTFLRPIAVSLILIRLNRTTLVKEFIERKQHINFFKILKSVNNRIDRHFT